MISTTHQVEQHILEYESRLEHMDELPGTTGEAGEPKRKTAEELQREELAQAGPMGVWDAVAQQLGKLMTRAGRSGH